MLSLGKPASERCPLKNVPFPRVLRTWDEVRATRLFQALAMHQLTQDERYVAEHCVRQLSLGCRA
jgi:hypothetical protein